MAYDSEAGADIWNGYLNEMRHDAIEKQKQQSPAETDIELLGRILYDVISIAKTARTYGLLAIEEKTAELDQENEAEAILFEAVQVIVDGNSPMFVAELLSNHYWVSGIQGYAATAAYIAIRGALLMQEGANPYNIKRLLSSVIPAGLREKCMQLCSDYEAQEQQNRDKSARIYFETDFSRSKGTKNRKELDWLERELSYMDDREIQRLLREVDNTYLVAALLGMGKNSRRAIALNMSARLREMIVEDCYQAADIADADIEEGAAYVTEKLKMLQAAGEIRDAESRNV